MNGSGIDFVVVGDICQTPSIDDLAILTNTALAVGSDGSIVWQCPAEDVSDIVEAHAAQGRLQRLSKGQFLTPGFIDTHIHASQHSYAGTGMDKPLMEWLDAYTFPVERQFAHLPTAEVHSLYRRAVRRTLRNGTTTAVYFATADRQASEALADVCAEEGQRAFVGKISMDRHCPPGYCETTEKSLEETARFIESFRQRPSIVQPVVTPRFIPTCSDELLAGLGALVREHGCHVQSHMSESIDEMQFVEAIHQLKDDHHKHNPYPPCPTDAEIFDRHGLLTDRCIMAHAIYLSEGDVERLRARGTAIAHCPLSNFYFAGGLLPVRSLLRSGVRVGLGTDVAGGYSPSMINAMQHAVTASRALSIQQHHERHRLAGVKPWEPFPAGSSDTTSPALDWVNALYLATRGGAEALNMGKQLGLLAEGYRFDAVLWDVTIGDNIDFTGSESRREQLEKLMHLGDDRNIACVWVDGQVSCRRRDRPAQADCKARARDSNSVSWRADNRSAHRQMGA
ncbi:unnamed protein product [Vitrella brassicaformis CCMP3155]|uniref:Guanine deaminase n=3 Tax=Vitrella brassicaformis TaxID=1169539 RepID=A0A0G4F551_VITBC|nr:unnamed protein product [Vitrella brassicaformis CCMP3155]|eukprot:CEM07623.1 unnamed protein product [Vitrella brassicaformis CCMP3155]